MVAVSRRVVQVELLLFLVTLGYGADNVTVDSCLRDKISDNCSQCPGGLANTPSCDICSDDRLDPRTNCTSCLPGNSNCQTGDFMLKITFHSYQNPSHRCGECLDPYPRCPVCCNTADQFDNCSSVCQLRLVASVEPFNSSLRDVFLPQMPPSFQGDEIEEFPVGPFNNTEGNISNPFIVNMSIWTGRFQFYVVVYDFYNPENVPPGRFAMDRFPLDISLGQEVPASIERKTYYGVYNIARFDLSFELTCSDGGSLPCSSATDVTMATSSSTPPGEAANFSVSDELVHSSSREPTAKTTNGGIPTEILGGAVGVGVAVLLVSLLCFILAFLLCRQRRKKKKTAYLTNESHPDPAGEIKMKDLDNPVYDATEQNNNASGKETVYSKPDTKGKTKQQKPRNGDEEREFQNSIYGHGLVSNSYLQPSANNAAKLNSASIPNGGLQQQPASAAPVQNGEATYSMSEEANYDTAGVGNHRYEMTHLPAVEEHYDVAHLPDDDQYDVAHPPPSGTIPNNLDDSHLPLGNHYDVAHLPADDQYDVAHAPVDLALYPPSNEYDITHLASDIYTEPNQHTSEMPRDDEDYDVAHPPPTGLPGQEDYDVAHPPPTASGLPGQEDYDVAHPPPTASGLPEQEDYDVAHPLPHGNNYETVDGQGDYDVAIIPGGNGSGLGHLHDNPRYESTDLPPIDIYSAPNAPSESANANSGQYSVFNRK